MNFKLRMKVKNLGMIESAELDLSSLTIFAGVNHSGKSYVSRFLYSLLKALQCDRQSLYFGEISRNLNRDDLCLFNLSREIEEVSQVAKQEPPQIDYAIEDPYEDVAEIRKRLSSFTALSNPDELIMHRVKPTQARLRSLQDFFGQPELVARQKCYYSIGRLNRDLPQLIASLQQIIDYKSVYEDAEVLQNIYASEIAQRLHHNFQVTSLSSLLRTGAEELNFSLGPADDPAAAISCSISQDGKLSLGYTTLETLNSWNRITAKLIYLESPLRAKLAEELISCWDSNQTSADNGTSLSGVPEYLESLQQEVKFSKTANRESLNPELVAELEEQLGGRIMRFSSGELAYRTKTGQTMDPQLISAGALQLSFLCYLIDSQIIKQGSVLFYNEPEANLHPRWQNFIIRVLYKLAEQGVHIVISTHSANLVKWLQAELEVPNKKLDGLLSINLFAEDGTSDLIADRKTACALVAESLTADSVREYFRTI